MSKTKLCVLFGGRSSEYEVSLSSAYSVLTNIDKNILDSVPVGITKGGKWYLFEGDLDKIKNGTWCENEEKLSRVVFDPAPGEANFIVLRPDGEIERIKADVVFPVLHGANGEDGTIQGMLELAEVPFVGADHTSSGVCMDKAFTKIIAEKCGVRQARAVILTKFDAEAERAAAKEEIKTLGYPVFVKPSRAGSSVGVSKVKSETELDAAIEKAFGEDSKILVEEFIKGREIEVAVMESGGKYSASVPGEIDPGCEFYDYDTKYISDVASYYIPARLSVEETEKVRDTAVKIFKALDCRGLSRVDFFATDEGDIVFNEINTIPGFTPISMYPKLFMEGGMTYSDVISALVNSALQKS